MTDPAEPRVPTLFEEVVLALPHLSDAERGRLRALLMQPNWVRREFVTPPKTQPTEGES